MKLKMKSILGIAAASAFALSAGANAAWFGHGNDASNTGEHHSFFSSMFHGKNTSTYMWNGYEVATPSQVNESAPWMANQPHMPGTVAVQTSGNMVSNMVGAVSNTTADTYGTGYASGASSGMSGYGTNGYDSSGYGATTSNGYGTTAYDSNGYGNSSANSSRHGLSRFFHSGARMNGTSDMTFVRSGRPYWALDS